MDVFEIIGMCSGVVAIAVAMYSLGVIRGMFCMENEYEKLLDDYENTIEGYAKSCEEYREAYNNYKRIVELQNNELSQHTEG